MLYEVWSEAFEFRPLPTGEINGSELVSIRPLPLGEINADQIEAFLSVGFTNHAPIVEKTKTLDERWYYVLACAKGTWTVEQLQQHLRAAENPSIGLLLCEKMNKGFVEFAVRDKSKPLGIATYKTLKSMPKPYQTLAPVIEGVKRVLTENAKANVPQKNTKRKGAKK